MDQRSFGIFACLYMGYTIITYIRKSVSFASPAVMESEALSKSQFGLILSSQTLGYSIGKLIGGVLVDMYSPSRIFISTLILAAFSVVAFTAFNSVSLFAFCWFVNGFCQGPAWPACARLIKAWFPAERFGTWWSVLSTAMNVSGTAGPLLSTFLLTLYTWRFSLSLAATGAIAVSGMGMLLLSDRPSDMPDSSKQKEDRGKTKSVGSEWMSGVKELFMQPVYIATCANYLLVSLVRGACTDWGQLYLIQDKHHSLLIGSSFISSLELGGIMGSLAAGYASDFLLSKRYLFYNPRHLVIFICTIVQSASVFLFISIISSSSSSILISLIGFCMGFGVYGAIALFGVVAMESAADNLAGTAHAIVALAANVGLVLSGLPFSLVAKHLSWHAAFFFVQGFAVVTTALALFSVLSSTPAAIKVRKD